MECPRRTGPYLVYNGTGTLSGSHQAVVRQSLGSLQVVRQSEKDFAQHQGMGMGMGVTSVGVTHCVVMACMLIYNVQLSQQPRIERLFSLVFTLCTICITHSKEVSGNQGKHQNFEPSILPYKFGLIFIGMKQKNFKMADSKKTEIFKIPNSQNFSAKISQIGPWVSKID